jgi:protein ImuB
MPRFPVVALGGDPGADAAPIAVTAPGAPDRIQVASAALQERGVLAGMRIAAARALAGDLDLRPWDEPALQHAVTAVTIALLDASPQVTPGAPGLWWIGAHGLGARGGERALLARVLAVARAWHPAPRAAVASSCVAARAATWLERAAPIVPAGRDAAFLARTPLALVPMDAELREALAALGVSHAGRLAALAPADVEARWGAAGLAAWRLARGDDPRRPALVVPPAPHVAAADLPTPVTTLEPVYFLVRAALDRLVREVARDGRAVAAFEVTLVLDGSGSALPAVAPPSRTATRRVTCAQPLARVEPLFEQCRAVLDDWRLDAPVVGVRVQVTERAPLTGHQGDLLHTGWRDPAAADAAFARLRAALGPAAVVAPAAGDSHAPERKGRWTDGRMHSPAAHPPARPSAHPSLRLLPEPEPIALEGRPPAFSWRGRWWPIAAREEVERLSGEWWGAPYARDYERWVSEGARFLVFRAARQWHLQGWWD